MTPSWANSQPWRVYIATGETLRQIQKAHLAHAQQGIQGNADFSTMHREDWDIKSRRNMAHWSQEIQQFLGMSNGVEFSSAQSQLFNAPALVYLTIPKKSSYWTIFDLGAFSQTLMLSAYGKGIGSMSAYEIVKYPKLIRQFMDIPDDQTIAMGIALGYPDEKKINGFVSDREEIKKMLEIKK